MRMNVYRPWWWMCVCGFFEKRAETDFAQPLIFFVCARERVCSVSFVLLLLLLLCVCVCVWVNVYWLNRWRVRKIVFFFLFGSVLEEGIVMYNVKTNPPLGNGNWNDNRCLLFSILFSRFCFVRSYYKWMTMFNPNLMTKLRLFAQNCLYAEPLQCTLVTAVYSTFQMIKIDGHRHHRDRRASEKHVLLGDRPWDRRVDSIR